jgi:hypothetical protein
MTVRDAPLDGGYEGAEGATMAAVDARRDELEPDVAAADDDTVGQRAMVATGATYRQLDYWTRRGYLRAANPWPGSGHRRRWPAREQRVCALIVRLLDVGIDLHLAVRIAREAAEHNTTWARLGDGVHIAWTPRGLPA